jgi:hypothetical protein
MFFLANRSKIYVKKFSMKDGSFQGALLAFNGTIKNDLISRFKENYNLEGDYIKDGGRISPQSILALIGTGGGALGLSAAASGQLFLATANPTTLMAIGNGVGSAVMGAGGITGHAPFIPLAGGIMPVAAPLLAFQAITTIMLMNEFKSIHEKLNHIEKSINRIVQRSEATLIGEIISASKRIEEIELEFAICNQFTPAMIIRLALVEDKVSPIFERYKFLYEAQSIDKHVTVEDLKFKENDAYFAIILSVLDLRIDFLRLKLAVQDNPGYMKHAVNRLVGKADYYRELWAEINMNPGLINLAATELREAVEEMNWWHRNVPEWLGGNRSAVTESQEKAARFENDAEKLRNKFKGELNVGTKLANGINEALSKSEEMSLIYWRDEFGEHSYYTSDLQLVAKPKGLEA